MAEIAYSTQKTRDAIVRAYVEDFDDEHRAHLGCSILGHDCERYVWYSWRWCRRMPLKAEGNGRLARLFRTGHLEEPRVAADLRRIGVNLHVVGPDGKQASVHALGGHLGGSMDGAGLGFPEGPKTWAVWENKTSGTKGFREMQAKGLREAKPQHWVQINMYMGLTGMHRGMYTMVCKETDEIYSEWVHFDKETFDRMMARAERIVRSNEPPLRMSQDPTFFKCKFCDMHPICHGERMPEVNCRTCSHSTPELDKDDRDVGRWSCAKHKADIPVDDQRQAYPCHRYIPIFLERVGKAVGYAEDMGNVIFETDDRVWQHGEGPGAISSVELHRMATPLAAAVAAQAKGELAAAGFTPEVVG